MFWLAGFRLQISYQLSDDPMWPIFNQSQSVWTFELMVWWRMVSLAGERHQDTLLRSHCPSDWGEVPSSLHFCSAHTTPVDGDTCQFFTAHLALDIIVQSLHCVTSQTLCFHSPLVPYALIFHSPLEPSLHQGKMVQTALRRRMATLTQIVSNAAHCVTVPLISPHLLNQWPHTNICHITH